MFDGGHLSQFLLILNGSKDTEKQFFVVLRPFRLSTAALAKQFVPATTKWKKCIFLGANVPFGGGGYIKLRRVAVGRQSEQMLRYFLDLEA